MTLCCSALRVLWITSSCRKKRRRKIALWLVCKVSLSHLLKGFKIIYKKRFIYNGALFPLCVNFRDVNIIPLKCKSTKKPAKWNTGKFDARFQFIFWELTMCFFYDVFHSSHVFHLSVLKFSVLFLNRQLFCHRPGKITKSFLSFFFKINELKFLWTLNCFFWVARKFVFLLMIVLFLDSLTNIKCIVIKLTL